MDTERRGISTEQRQSAVYLKTIVKMSLAQNLKLRNQAEDTEYKRAMISVMINIDSQTDQTAHSLNDREQLMMKALNYLYREVRTHCELRKYENNEAGESLLKEIVALITSASLVLPVQMPPVFN